jgi:hypothetical protein
MIDIRIEDHQSITNSAQSPLKYHGLILYQMHMLEGFLNVRQKAKKLDLAQPTFSFFFPWELVLH